MKRTSTRCSEPPRNPFYTYSGLTSALSAYPKFTTTGDDTVKKQRRKTALWFWSTQATGVGTIIAHNAMVDGKGFGETIRTITENGLRMPWWANRDAGWGRSA